MQDGEINVWKSSPPGALIDPGDVLLVSRAAKRLDSEMPAWHVMHCTDILKAIALLEWCSVAPKSITGIWAYVYLRGVHIGYIWTQKFHEPVSHLQLAGANR